MTNWLYNYLNAAQKSVSSDSGYEDGYVHGKRVGLIKGIIIGFAISLVCVFILVI